METKKRSLIKTISWRLVSIIVLITVSYIITGDWVETGWFIIAFFGMTVLYYFHERFWDSINLGKK